MADEERNLKRDIWIGVGFYFLMGAVSFLIGVLGSIILKGFSLVVAALVHISLIVRLILWCRKTGRWTVFKGWLIALGVTFLLMAACFGVVLFLASGARIR